MFVCMYSMHVCIYLYFFISINMDYSIVCFFQDELSSESVERLKVNTTESFNKFKDANVVSGNSGKSYI